MSEVSVIIPLYNKEKYISRALDSVFAQTFKDFEVIVVDDGSTDEGPKIVDSYSDERLRVIRQENSGPGAARNCGIRESSSPLLAFLDADDEWLPEFLEKSTGWLKEHPDCDLSISGLYFGPDRVARYRQGKFKEGVWKLSPDLSGNEMQSIAGRFYSWVIVCKREILERFGGFYEKDHCMWCEDRYLWIQVQLNCKVYMNPEPLVWWHTEASNLRLNRAKGRPIPPFLTDPDPIRQSCPPEHRLQLEQWLAVRAKKVTLRLTRSGDLSSARDLLNRFPFVHVFGPEHLAYIGLRIDMIFASFFKGCLPVHCLAKWFLTAWAWMRRKPLPKNWWHGWRDG
jgi:glycosyltransferase involved in cell wall biosynthesis